MFSDVLLTLNQFIVIILKRCTLLSHFEIKTEITGLTKFQIKIKNNLCSF